MNFIKLVDDNVSIFKSNDFVAMQNFLQNLEKICANHFAVPNCPVLIEELSPTRTSFGNSPPACFKCSYHKKSQNNPISAPQIIVNKNILTSYPYIKIIKLLMHEWMHYLSYYHLHISPCNSLHSQYLGYINKADDVKKLHIENLENTQLARSLQKLSPSEFVADLFARDVLRFISTQTQNDDLKIDAENKIIHEEDMQTKHLNNINKICKKNYSNSNEIEFEKIVKLRRMKNDKTT